jgi:hypothetical protein
LVYHNSIWLHPSFEQKLSREPLVLDVKHFFIFFLD